jgi:hypothetical protein
VVHRSTEVAGQPLGGRSAQRGDPEEPDDHALGLSRGGIGPKIHPATDGAGLPLAFSLTTEQRHEPTAFERTLRALRLPGPRGRPRTRPKHLAGDKAYSNPARGCVSASPSHPVRDPSRPARAATWARAAPAPSILSATEDALRSSSASDG